MDYKKLKKYYGRLMGIKKTIDAETSVPGEIGDDYNNIITNIGQITGEDLNNLKIPQNFFDQMAGDGKTFILSFICNK